MTGHCSLCPRHCLAERTDLDPGRCGAAERPDSCRVARLMAHFWEEPWISGTRGSGTVFFSGCSLGCIFCQNAAISQGHQGTVLTQSQLVQELLQLNRLGVHNLNLVTASHYANLMPDLFRELREQPEWQANPLPVIWNSSSYETAAAIKSLDSVADIFLPDLKFFDPTLSAELAGAPDYFEVACHAVLTMHRLRPEIILDQAGLLRRGMAIRHLVLPGHWQDSCQILDFIAQNLPLDTPLSIMCQYTPPDKSQADSVPVIHPELRRRLTTFEYRKVLDHALALGFSKIIGQRRPAADAAYTPDFSSLWILD